MDVGAGIKLYKKYISPLKEQGYKLGLPATSSAPAGFDWVDQFVKQCGDECPVRLPFFTRVFPAHNFLV